MSVTKTTDVYTHMKLGYFYVILRTHSQSLQSWDSA